MAPRITVYDNGGVTFDRYSVIVGDHCYSMSHNALSPQGVNQYACELAEVQNIKGFPANLGTLVKLSSLPQDVQKAIELIDESRGR